MRTKLDAKDRAKMVELRIKRHRTLKQIATQFRVTVSCVSDILRQEGVDHRRAQEWNL